MAGSWNKWYARMIPRAEQLYEIYLKERAAEGRQPVTSYTKWDRDAYIERVGGPEEAERRRKTLMARQSGQRLADERKQRGLTQAQLAQIMGVTPGRISQIERGELSTIEAIARYVQALGGRLEPRRQLRRPHPHSHHHRSRLTNRYQGRASSAPQARARDDGEGTTGKLILALGGR